MTVFDVGELVREFLPDHFGFMDDTIFVCLDDNVSFYDELGADEEEMAELHLWAEEAFDIWIGDVEFDAVETIGDFINLILKNLG